MVISCKIVKSKCTELLIRANTNTICNWEFFALIITLQYQFQLNVDHAANSLPTGRNNFANNISLLNVFNVL